MDQASISPGEMKHQAPKLEPLSETLFEPGPDLSAQMDALKTITIRAIEAFEGAEDWVSILAIVESSLRTIRECSAPCTPLTTSFSAADCGISIPSPPPTL